MMYSKGQKNFLGSVGESGMPLQVKKLNEKEKKGIDIDSKIETVKANLKRFSEDDSACGKRPQKKIGYDSWGSLLGNRNK